MSDDASFPRRDFLKGTPFEGMAIEDFNVREGFEWALNELLKDHQDELARSFGWEPNADYPITLSMASGKITRQTEDGPESVYLCQCGAVTRIGEEDALVECRKCGFSAVLPVTEDREE